MFGDLTSELQELELGKLMKVVLEQINAEPEIYTEIAKMIKGLYDALIQQGFTEEQAMTLVAKQSGNMFGGK